MILSVGVCVSVGGSEGSMNLGACSTVTDMNLGAGVDVTVCSAEAEVHTGPGIENEV